jgi:hypothetical protein
MLKWSGKKERRGEKIRNKVVNIYIAEKKTFKKLINEFARKWLETKKGKHESWAN